MRKVLFSVLAAAIGFAGIFAAPAFAAKAPSAAPMGFVEKAILGGSTTLVLIVALGLNVRVKRNAGIDWKGALANPVRTM